MKKLLAVILVGLAVCFGASTAFASPLLPLEQGDYAVFAEYGPDGYLYPYSPSVGLGVGLTDDLTVGVTASITSSGTFFGGYADLSLGSFLVKADLLYDPFIPGFYGKLAGLYRFDVGACTLAAGLAVFNDFGAVSYGLEGDIQCPLGDNSAIYGGVNYMPGSGDTNFYAGVSWEF